MCKANSVNYDQKTFIHLLQNWYRNQPRVMQAVHPRDLIKTVVSICRYEQMEPALTPALIDEACEGYFVN
jgi:hypothetical protein